MLKQRVRDQSQCAAGAASKIYLLQGCKARRAVVPGTSGLKIAQYLRVPSQLPTSALPEKAVLPFPLGCARLGLSWSNEHADLS